MDKVTWTEAAKMEKDIGAYIIHIDWIPELEEKYPDCNAVVIDCEKRWSDPTGQLFLVIDDPEEEEALGGFYKRLADRLD